MTCWDALACGTPSRSEPSLLALSSCGGIFEPVRIGLGLDSRIDYRNRERVVEVTVTGITADVAGNVAVFWPGECPSGVPALEASPEVAGTRSESGSQELTSNALVSLYDQAER